MGGFLAGALVAFVVLSVIAIIAEELAHLRDEVTGKRPLGGPVRKQRRRR